MGWALLVLIVAVVWLIASIPVGLLLGKLMRKRIEDENRRRESEDA